MVAVSYLITFIVLCLCDSLARCATNCTKGCMCLGHYVDCSQKKFTSVPSNIPEWTLQLNLNNNRILAFKSDAFRNLSQLTELKLNKNHISLIPKDAFDSLKQLKLLELNRNQLGDLEALTFKSLEQLTVLKLKRNRITLLKDGAFFGLKRIKSLMLDYNKIEKISKIWLYGLNSLKELTISNNNVNVIEIDAWEFCMDLVDLDLSYNRISSIKKDTFKHLNNLQKLLLNNNEITFIEENVFEHLPNLKILQLDNNRVSWTIEDANGIFGSLKNLLRFSIRYNNIKTINKNAFKGLGNVVSLNINNNNITSIQKNAFIELPSLKELYLNTSALLCDCNLRWFHDWLNARKYFNVQTICAYPDSLRGTDLMNVSVSNFTCDDLPKPRLIEEPEAEIMALKNENISLSCKAMSSDAGTMTFTWKKDNLELTNITAKVSATLDGKNTESVSVLNIYNVQHSDAGKYQCVVSNKFGTTYSQKSTISVLIFPTFVKIPQNVTIKSGTTARLECAAYGEPLPEIAWQKDGGNDFPAARERRMHVMPTDDVFFIINAKLSDMGVYSCTANNAAGTIVANASLVIEEIPFFVKAMENKEITAGDSVVIQCMAGGQPKPTIQWLKDGLIIHPTERHFFTAEDQLMIIVDTVLSDAGTYQCVLNNSLGIKNGFSTLKVKPGISTENELMGIIIITVVCCAVLTSFIWVVIIYQTRKRMTPPKVVDQQVEQPILDINEKMLTQFGGDNTSEHSSCKDSGTGDSARRSNDDLLPNDEYTLIIENNPDDKSTTMRAASLIYLMPDGNHSHVPLLHKDELPYQRSTNHDRLDNNSLLTSDINNTSENITEITESAEILE